MGNEKSALNGLQIEEKSVEITDFWIHKTASVNGYAPRKLSVFISEPSLHYEASFGKPSPLEKAAKNLMLHRHPCILRYISSLSKSSKFYLTTEQVRPLIQAVETQNTLQICMGLYSILRALVFLHEKASASHNNVLTPAYLHKIRSYRYDKAISPEEDAAISSSNYTAIDAYAFGILAEDILKFKNTDDVPSLLEFREFCKENLQNPDPRLRSELSSVLGHSFFTHDFLRIHAFLEELPLKNDLEKEAFFENLVIQLRAFPENVVAEQLGRLLLSRIVLLDSTAQKKLLPFVLKPKDEKNNAETSLFSIPTFKIYLVPKLLQMFCIRDASIRLVLLLHFNSFVGTFQADELKSQVLPELLVGIKDTNDHLVCATLRALAEVVPILGAATVIGGNRGKLFTDGRPNKMKESKECNGAIGPSFSNVTEFNVPAVTNCNKVNLPERPSPDGGEDKGETTLHFTEEESTWSDWDAQETAGAITTCEASQVSLKVTCDSGGEIAISESVPTSASTTSPLNTAREDKTNSNEPLTKLTKKPTTLSDISELDIKNSKSIDSKREEYDFFTDMEPVIRKTQVLHVDEQLDATSKSMFDVKVFNGSDAAEENNAWDGDLSDWEMDDNQE